MTVHGTKQRTPSFSEQSAAPSTQSLQAKLAVIGCLYIAFGMASGFFYTAVPAIFRQRGVSLEVIGLCTLTYLPFGLSFLWAPLVDRYYSRRIGRRRTWMLGCQVLSGMAVLIAATTPPEVSVSVAVGAFALLCLAAATLDIAIDGYAVENLQAHERGWGSGVQGGGMFLGRACGGGGLLILYEALGWQSCLLLMVIVSGLSLFPMFLRAEALPPAESEQDGKPTASIAVFFRRRDAWLIMLFMLVLYGPMSLGLGMIHPFLVGCGLSLSDIGWTMGTGGSLAGLAGAMFAGRLINPLGRRGAIACFGLVLATLMGGLALVAALRTQHVLILLLLVCTETFVYSTFAVAVATVAMDWSSLAQAGTDYTIMQCTMYMVSILAMVGGGFLASALGWALFFMLSALLLVSGIATAFFLFPRIEAART